MANVCVLVVRFRRVANERRHRATQLNVLVVSVFVVLRRAYSYQVANVRVRVRAIQVFDLRVR